MQNESNKCCSYPLMKSTPFPNELVYMSTKTQSVFSGALLEICDSMGSLNLYTALGFSSLAVLVLLTFWDMLDGRWEWQYDNVSNSSW